ncbi:DNA polymerase III subunit alpha [Candidatus Uhrbacteria bacterium]|nr:DNA polymerase III subunit alpha [Candidatus Uhrbacteria bacterium]
MNFVHLHTHSHYSLLEAVPKIPDLIRRVKELGMTAVALTDHGALYGAIEFYQQAKKAGIQPIIGLEANLAPHGRREKRPKIDDRPFHLTLLAENQTGYRNLMKLSSLGFLEGFYYRPRLDRELIEQYHQGIIALSGCLRGEIPQALAQHDRAKARQLIRTYQELFGRENFFLELVYQPELPLQMAVNAELIELSAETGAPMAATRNSHYLFPEDQEIHAVLLAIQSGKTVEELRREEVDRSLLGPEEMAEAFRDVPEAIRNTAVIAERCKLELELGKWHFPSYELPEGKTPEVYLVERANEGLRERIPEITPEIQERLNYELGIINQRGYATYFLVVADYVHWARENNIIATTRGSAAGSLVSYSIGITTVNPLYFKLPFERFLNPFRPSPPDIDMDFSDTERDRVIAYVTEKYGADKVAQICTFGAMLARGSVRDVGRALGLPYDFCDRVAKMIPLGSQGFPMTIARAKEENPELLKLSVEDAEVKRLLNLAERIEGNSRHVSVHAAGVVISPAPLMDFTPLQRESGGERLITQYEMNAVEAAGVLKMDFLGIRNLSILGQAVELARQTKGLKVDLQTIPFDDPKTFELLGRGDTVGLFQLNGSGMTRYLVELKPTNIFDIMAMVALFRPGPMESIPEFIRRKHNPALISYLDPRMKEILSMSYGVVTYQDDVLLLAIHLAGYSWEEADKLRKAMGKKIPEEMAKQKDKFLAGCQEKGKLSAATSQELWRLIEPFAAYGFNKCLSGDTRIMDPGDGSYKTMAELYHQQTNGSIVTLTDNFRLRPQSRRGVITNGIKPVFELKTRSGRRVCATANHPFLKVDGWTRLDRLSLGDRIAVPRLLPAGPGTGIDKRKLRVLGYLIAAGNLGHPSGIYFYSRQEEEIQDFVTALAAFGSLRVTIDRSKSAAAVYVGQKNRNQSSNNLRNWLAELGLLGKKATEKTLPDIVYAMDEEELSVLMAGMWQGDGCVHPKKDGQIFYAASSEHLAGQLQHLLLRLGVCSAVHRQHFRYRGSSKIGYAVYISRQESVDRFFETVEKFLLIGQRRALEQICAPRQSAYAGSGGIIARGAKDVIPKTILATVRDEITLAGCTVSRLARDTGLAERIFFLDTRRWGYTRPVVRLAAEYLGSTGLEEAARSDVSWDEIVSITPLGEEMTYDLEVPVNHNFIANDIVVHNSHAASYAVVAYQTAYMKANFPAEFMTAVLTAESGDLETVAEVVSACRAMGIEVLPPDVNESQATFTYLDDSRISFGLVAIKNLGEDIIAAIIDEREGNGTFRDLADFLRRIAATSFNRKSLEALIRTGALDQWGERNQLFENIELLLAYRRDAQREVSHHQGSLFGTAGGASALRLRPAPAMSRAELLRWEKELLGLYVSEHPFGDFAVALRGLVTPLRNIHDGHRGRKARLAGIWAQTKEIVTKSGEPMMFARLEDATSSLEVILFPRVYRESKMHLIEGGGAVVIGTVDAKEGSLKILADYVWPLRPDNLEATVKTLAGAARVT